MPSTCMISAQEKRNAKFYALSVEGQVLVKPLLPLTKEKMRAVPTEQLRVHKVDDLRNIMMMVDLPTPAIQRRDQMLAALALGAVTPEIKAMKDVAKPPPKRKRESKSLHKSAAPAPSRASKKAKTAREDETLRFKHHFKEDLAEGLELTVDSEAKNRKPEQVGDYEYAPLDLRGQHAMNLYRRTSERFQVSKALLDLPTTYVTIVTADNPPLPIIQGFPLAIWETYFHDVFGVQHIFAFRVEDFTDRLAWIRTAEEFEPGNPLRDAQGNLTHLGKFGAGRFSTNFVVSTLPAECHEAARDLFRQMAAAYRSTPRKVLEDKPHQLLEVDYMVENPSQEKQMRVVADHFGVTGRFQSGRPGPVIHLSKNALPTPPQITPEQASIEPGLTQGSYPPTPASAASLEALFSQHAAPTETTPSSLSSPALEEFSWSELTDDQLALTGSDAGAIEEASWPELNEEQLALLVDDGGSLFATGLSDDFGF